CTNDIFVWTDQANSVRRIDPGGAAWPAAAGGGVSFAEDHSGNIWVGLAGSAGLLRIREGQLQRFTVADGIPGGVIWALLVDKKGRLWMGSSEGGLGRLDLPDASQPRFQTYTTSSGLSSNQIWNLIDDNAGYIYASTGRGLDRLEISDPDSLSIRKFSDV